jgi:enediyne polyketide synthase
VPPQPRGARTGRAAGPAHPWYGGVFFHGGRFRRLIGYDELSAFGVRAWITSPDDPAWFSEFHSGQLLFGDPGAHDEALHVLLACVPHRRALPIGADRVTVWREREGPLRVPARERSHGGGEYSFDVDLVQPDGTAVARWDGLRLRAVGPLDWPDGIPARLTGPWLSRRLIECGVDDHTELWTGGNPFTLSTNGNGLRGAVTLIGESEVDGLVERQARELAEVTEEDPALSLARSGAMAEASATLGGAPEPPEVDRITEDGLMIARSVPLRLVTAPVVVRETGRQVVVGLAEEV